jgi:hypothetical protein
MANFDPVKIQDDLTSIQEKILDIVDELDEIAQAAASSSGKIKELIPGNLSITMDQLTDLVDGTNPYAISQLIDLIANMPLKDLTDPKRKKRSEIRKENEAKSEELGSVGEGPDESDLTPDTTEGARSQIAQESVDPLAAFIRGGMSKENNRVRESGGLSYDRLREIGLGGHIEGGVDSNLIESMTSERQLMSAKAIPNIRKRITEVTSDAEDGGEPPEGMSLEESGIMGMAGVVGGSVGMPPLDLNELA